MKFLAVLDVINFLSLIGYCLFEMMSCCFAVYNSAMHYLEHALLYSVIVRGFVLLLMLQMMNRLLFFVTKPCLMIAVAVVSCSVAQSDAANNDAVWLFPVRGAESLRVQVHSANIRIKPFKQSTFYEIQ